MRRLMVLCVCGERIQVPRSALGRTGLCPACGRVISITAESATTVKGPVPAKPAPVQNAEPFANASWNSGNGRASAVPVEAKRRFAEAVDLYFSQRYAQALSIFESLAEDFPENTDIVSGRQMCMVALRNRQQMALEHQPGSSSNLPAPIDGRAGEPVRRLAPPTESIPDSVVEDTLKHVLVEKMLNGADDRVQLRAAELAIRVFGFGKKKEDGNDAAQDSESIGEADSDATETSDPGKEDES
ncbi:MAG: hypothetical protein AMXMBFR82_25010 [Candidatus Hydrogenedentota bacterium]